MDRDTPSVFSDPVSSSQFHQISFTGAKAEYFKLWIVNVLLSIVTLGIYSAWAKVRNTQYMYGHTKVDGHSLEYLAKPMQILKGRIIAFALFAGYVFFSQFYPTASIFFSLFIAVLAPVLVVQGLRFNLRHTAYRNVRFGFTGTYSKAYLCFLLFPILNLFTVGLATPWVLKRIDSFVYGNLTFGDKATTAELRTGVYYKAAFAAIGVIILTLLLVAVVTVALIESNVEVGLSENAAVGGALGYLGGFITMAVFYAMRRNHLFNNLASPELAEFRSDLKVGRYAWLTLSNILLLVCTLGLAYPVTKIRKNKVLAAATEVYLTDQIDHMAASSQELDSSLGEEVGGIFDADMSLT